MTEEIKNCTLCGKEIVGEKASIFSKQFFHLHCLRKLRKKARVKYGGNMNLAIKDLRSGVVLNASTVGI